MVSPIDRACPKIVYGYSVQFSILNIYASIPQYLIICVYIDIKDGCIKVARYDTLRTKHLVNYTCALLLYQNTLFKNKIGDSEHTCSKYVIHCDNTRIRKQDGGVKCICTKTANKCTC